jgi:cytochrome P450
MENKMSQVPYSYTGFFGGPRSCIGKHLAYLESKIVVIKLLMRYKEMKISEGGERMEVRFLYGPEKFYVRVGR